METTDHASCDGGRVCVGVFYTSSGVFQKHPEHQMLVAVAGMGGAGGMDGDCFRAGGSRYAASCVLSHWRFGIRILAWPAVDARGDTGRLLCPVSVCALGWQGFRPTPLAAGRAAQRAFSWTFCSVSGLCRAPAPHQRARHQFFAGAIPYPTPPLFAGDGLRDSA